MKLYHWIIIVGLVFVLGVAGGFFGGRKWRDPQPPIIDAHKLDSILNVNQLLQDSLSSVQAEVKVVKQDVIKYRTVYDSIFIYTDAEIVVQNLRATATTPIRERGN